jgi:hypothetical protein
MKQKLIFWGIYVAVYYLLWSIVGLTFSLPLFIVLLAVFLTIFLGQNSWWLRCMGYIGIMISLFSDGLNNGTSAIFARIFILALGFLGFGLEYLYQIGSDDYTKEKVDKDFKIILQRCPKCLGKIYRVSSKCPNCTADI